MRTFICNIHTSYSQRVCYRTRVCRSDGEIQCNLPQKLDDFCEHDSTEYREGDRTTLYMRSRRYNCTSKNDKPLNYKSNVFCIYNISMPCDTVDIRTIEDHTDLQSRNSYNECMADYVEFDFGQRQKRFCGNEIIERRRHTSDFIAVFWTNGQENHRGFELAITCMNKNNALTTATEPAGSGEEDLMF